MPDDPARRTLGEILATHGRSLCDEPKRLEALLRDLCPTCKREIYLLTGALREQVPQALLVAAGPRDLLLTRLTSRLRDDLALTDEAAAWAVESWALALGACGG